MSIKWISSSWQNYLNTEYPQDHRVYIDFRGKEYPPVLASGTYSVVTEADNQPGSHNMTGGYNAYFLEMPCVMSISARAKPACAYNVSSKQTIWSWYRTPSHYLSCYYISSQYVVAWAEGSTARTLVSGNYSDSTSLQMWTTIGATIDLRVATASGSQLWINGSSVADTWDDDIVSRDYDPLNDFPSSDYAMFQIRSENGSAGAITINNLRMFSTIAEDIVDDFKSRKEEEIYWPLNGHGTGHTRCNVSDRVTSFDIGRSIESPTGRANPNELYVELMSPNGEFSDDQYAEFAPASEIYNGWETDKYLQRRCPIEVETWYGGNFEPEFVGRIDENMFQRRSGIGDISRVSVGAMDGVDELQRRNRQKGRYYENYELSNTSTSSTSLLHTIAKLGTQKEWYNFLSNSSFENATAGNSWVVTGSSSTIARAAGGLVGSYQLDWLVPGATALLTQVVTFSGAKKLNKGQNWNLSIFGKTATSCNCNVRITELTSSGSVCDYSETGDRPLEPDVGWYKMETTQTISTSAVNSLSVDIISKDAATISLDCSMLVQHDWSLDWYVTNNNDGASGVTNADNADSELYDTVGFDVDDAMVVHPWARVEQGESIWECLTQIGDATAARYLGMDAAGTLKYRTIFKTSYADPTALATIDATQYIDTVLDVAQANKIVVHGVSIIKDTKDRQVWDAAACGEFTKDGTSWIRESVANGGYWPTSVSSYEFWASYGDVT